MIGVVLCSWQGARYLREQLDSISAQTLPAALYVHDDGSTDASVAIARAHPAVTDVHPHAANVGFVANFERAIRQALDAGCTHVALADQDDIWRPDRLARGMETMRLLEAEHGVDAPLLVHSDLAMIDERAQPLAPSFLDWRGYAIDRHADLPRMLGRCGVMGNTCLANRALLELALPFPAGLHVHDWWLGLLAELYGARGYVDEPLVAYRVHGSNASNARTTLDGGAGRATLKKLITRDFRLPFMEDGRVAVLDALIAGDGHRPPVSDDARRRIDAFRCYLTPGGRRSTRLRQLLAGGFLKPSRRHRLRVIAALLLTARYAGKG